VIIFRFNSAGVAVSNFFRRQTEIQLPAMDFDSLLGKANVVEIDLNPDIPLVHLRGSHRRRFQILNLNFKTFSP
jgi:hypothetical protein